MVTIVITKSDEYLIVMKNKAYTAVGSFAEARSRVGVQGENHAIDQRKNGRVGYFGMAFMLDKKGLITLQGELDPSREFRIYHKPTLFQWTKKEFLDMPVVEAQSFINLITGARLFMGQMQGTLHLDQ
jgi:hypothetical protein